jgi:two-component system sensor histidine kinase/response regulator
VESIEAVNKLGLKLKDFAIHDAAGDLLLMMQAQSTTLRELHRLSDSYRHELAARREIEEQLRAAVDRAEKASAAKAGFLTTISHEIRTPLNVVLGVLGLLEENLSGSELGSQVTAAREAGEGLLLLIGEILDMSRIEAGQLKLEQVRFEPAALLRGVSNMLRLQAAAKGLDYVSQVTGGEVTCLGDPGRIRQIVVNLAANAIKFTEQGSVRIGLQITPLDGGRSRLRFSVEDTGIGIDPARHGELFAEFGMLDSSYARRFGGAGLGLAISKRLAKLMDGDVGFTSTPGKGSLFWFEVALEQAPAGAEAEAVLATSMSEAGAPVRILLVEDMAANRKLAQAMLEGAGHEVESVDCGRDAVEAVQTSRPDLVLMDISMPGMDGLETTRLIRGLTGPASRVPIVAMTAHAMEGDRERFLEGGMDGYLVKPFNRARLLETVRRHARSNRTPSGNYSG